MIKKVDIAIVGAGPMGIATAIEAKQAGLTSILFERGTLVNSIYHFPDNMTFFSTSKKLEIGRVPFMSINDKPTRDEALEYYRRVVGHWQIDVRTNEEVKQIEFENNRWIVTSSKEKVEAKYVVVATGFYATANQLNVPGEDLPVVSYYYKNAHPYFGKKVAVVGGGNSACQVALDLYHRGADVTMIVRKPELKSTVKYWIKPNIENRIKEGSIKALFNTVVSEMKDHEIIVDTNGIKQSLPVFHTFAMIGYQPDYHLLEEVFGLNICDDEYRTPEYNKMQQTSLENVYLAGVVCGGLKTNTFLIENSKVHAESIINDILRKEAI